MADWGMHDLWAGMVDAIKHVAVRYTKEMGNGPRFLAVQSEGSYVL